MRTQVIYGLAERVTEEMPPHTIYRHLIQIFAVDHKLTKFSSTIHFGYVTAARNSGTIDEDRISDFGKSIALLIVNLRFRWLTASTFEILIDQFCKVDVARTRHKPTQCSRLTEECIELPKCLLFPIVKRVVVALSALNLQS